MAKMMKVMLVMVGRLLLLLLDVLMTDDAGGGLRSLLPLLHAPMIMIMAMVSHNTHTFYVKV